jgi:hypothetical protein
MSAGGAIDSSVTLDEVFTVLAAKRVPLAPELAGYLVLEIAEHADPSGGDVDPRSVFVGEEGTVALVKPRRDGASGDAEGSVRATLGRLLDASGSVTPALAAASRRKSGAGLRALADELETALIPVNRAAGRRALAHLAREVRRVTLGVGRNALPSSSEIASSRRPLSSSSPSMNSGGETPPPPSARGETPAPPSTRGETPPPPSARQPSPSFSLEEDPTTMRRAIPNELLSKATPGTWAELPTSQFEMPSTRGPSPSQADVDALIEQFGVSAGGEQNHARALKALVGLDATPPPPNNPGALAREAAARLRNGSSGDDIEALLGQETQAPPPPRPVGVAVGAADVSNERQLPTQPSQIRKMRASLASAPAIRKSGRGATLLTVLGLFVVGAGAVAVWLLRPGAASHRAAEAMTSASAQPAAAPRPAPACRGTLVVTNVPAHAEVLVREGQAPVDVERMPVGARLEFVATAEGFAPKRVVVPQGATWDRTPEGKPRFEAAVQLDRSKGGADMWPAGEPGSEVGGQGAPGTVHVVATPRGAEIWMLAGIGPDARVDQLPCDRDWDVLVAGPTTFRKRLHVGASDFRLEEPPAGAHVAHVSAK